jgi:hypothetical protein
MFICMISSNISFSNALIIAVWAKFIMKKESGAAEGQQFITSNHTSSSWCLF